jgi:DNA adenine methylase
MIKRPVMRYHGGKYLLAPWIVEHFPDHRIYTECFGGAASVLLRKHRTNVEVYNDLDEEVVNVFRVLRKENLAKKLARQLYLTPFSREEFERSYTSIKDPLEQARRTILRSFLSHGSDASVGNVSGFRATSNRCNTSPPQDWANFPVAIPDFVERLRGVIIECRPAIEVMQMHDTPETLHYVDPPYVWSTRMERVRNKGKGKGYRHELTDQQHVELIDALRKLKGMVVLSGYPNPIYDHYLVGWECYQNNGAKTTGPSAAVEALWLNPAAQGNMRQQRLILEVTP